jgi:hypothetical protein
MPAASSARPARKLPTRDVAISVRLDSAREVVLTGDFTGWSRQGIPLKPAGDGLWAATLKLAPGEYQYRLLVDGEWRDDPQAPRRVPNPFGSENGVLPVP